MRRILCSMHLHPCRLLAASAIALILFVAPTPGDLRAWSDAGQGPSSGSVKAFTGARVVDGTDRAPIDNATILVRDGKVVEVGPASAVKVPPNTPGVSLLGKTVVPGLINTHGHV